MLQQLTISNFILVERCQMDFSDGLAVLTGETGAGKSILLGALGLLMGRRAAGQPLFDTTHPAILNASFTSTPAIANFCQQNGLDSEEDHLLIRRQILPDGKSRAFINDQPISINLLKQLGELLVEIHGQQDQRELTDKAIQRQMLDQFGKHEPLLSSVKSLFESWKTLTKQREAKEANIQNAAAQEDYLRHIQTELSKLAPQVGEEEELAVKRRQLMQAEKLGGLLQDAQNELGGANPVESSLSKASRLLDRSDDPTLENPTLTQLLESLNDAQQSVAEALQHLDSLILDSGYDPKELDAIESRLFELRGASRKHKRPVDELASYLAEITDTLHTLDADDSALHQLLAEEEKAKKQYEQEAIKLTEARKTACETLAKSVMQELAPLKMEATRFKVDLSPLPPENWAIHGMDDVIFTASTNPGAPFGPLAKIASGGELSRFMLALKVVLADGNSHKTLIFDEIDTGTSGAVAEAIGERLKRLSQNAQVMVITHLPQVARQGHIHFKVQKETSDDKTRTSVIKLDNDQRKQELATMLSGKNITAEARQMAEQMLAV